MSINIGRPGQAAVTGGAGVQDLRQDFLRAMRRLAASVSIVTVRSPAGPMGMIATAVSSLCAEPPSLLVCVNQSASMHDALTHASAFAVNILHASELDTAHLFADAAHKHLRFEDPRWVITADAPPVLSSAQAVLLCDLAGVPVFGTHSICVGVVRDARSRADVDPLIYLDGKFATAPPHA